MDERTAVRLRWSSGAVAIMVVIGAAAGAAVVLGGFDSSALKGYAEPINWLIHRTMIDSVRVRARAITPPQRFTKDQVMAGFRLYDRHCAVCHGAPGLGRQGWVVGMHPAPPYLLDVARHWRPRELYFIVSNGVKMTAMPAWSPTLSQKDMWSVVAFLEALPQVSATDYASLDRLDLTRTAARPTPASEGVTR